MAKTDWEIESRAALNLRLDLVKLTVNGQRELASHQRERGATRPERTGKL
jgi:hypothetical protein